MPMRNRHSPAVVELSCFLLLFTRYDSMTQHVVKSSSKGGKEVQPLCQQRPRPSRYAVGEMKPSHQCQTIPVKILKRLSLDGAVRICIECMHDLLKCPNPPGPTQRSGRRRRRRSRRRRSRSQRRRKFRRRKRKVRWGR